jgi:3-oxoacyl-[acyl-carrier-protein] synthase III
MGNDISTLPIGIRNISYCLGDSIPIDELPEMVADDKLLKRFKDSGFKNYARSSLTMAEQAGKAALATIERSGLTAKQIDAVVIGTSELRDWNDFPEDLSKEILRIIGFNIIPVVGTTLAGCANLANSIKVARNMIIAENLRNVLVIETNQVRGSMQRLEGILPSEIPATLFGDGAVSCIVTNEATEFYILGMEQIVSQFHNDKIPSQAIVAKDVASYRHVIERALKKAMLEPKDIHCYLAGNNNAQIFEGMKNILGFGSAESFTENLQSYGHIWSADTLINLQDYCNKVSPKMGTYFLMLSQASNYYSAIVCQKR